MTMTPAETATDDRASLSAAGYLFHGLSDRSRLAILRHLAEGDLRVVDLTGRLGLAQSTVSQHLACLKGCGLVRSRPWGRATMWSLTHPESTIALLAAAEHLLDDTGSSTVLCPRSGAPSLGEEA